MKKLMCIVVCLAVLGGIVFTAGCGGSSGGIGAIIAGALIVAAIASSGGAGAAAFAASVRERPATAIYAQTATSKYKAKIIVKDAAGTVVTSTETTKLYVDSTGKQLSFDKITFSLNEGKYDVVVEYYSANAAAGADPFYKKYEYVPITSGATTDKSTLTVTATDTAYALSYDSWKTTKTGATSMYFADFTGQSPNVSSVTTDIVTVLSGLGSATPSDAFVWTTAKTDAAAVAASTTVPTTSSTSTTTTSTVYSGTTTLLFNYGLDFNNAGTSAPQAVLNSITTNGKVLSYFQYTGSYLFGNYAKFNGTDDSRLFRYKDSTSSLSAITAGITFGADATNPGGYNYNHHAEVSKQTVSGVATATMGIGDVYYFYVGGYYGVLKITSLTSGVSLGFDYKYNKTAGSTDLTYSSTAATTSTSSGTAACSIQ